ncbi:MAG: hypothetical protein ABI543_14060 [Ignavibacteria bacterium]
MKKTVLLLSLFLTFCMFSANSVFSSPPEKTGTLNVKINGVQYSADLFTETNPYAYEVTAGNKNYEIRLSWMYVNSPADIFTGSSDLNESNGNIKVKYIDFLSSMNFWTHGGKITVTGNDGNKITGEFSFKAAGTENNWSTSKNTTGSGSTTERQISDGTFEIYYNNK